MTGRHQERFGIYSNPRENFAVNGYNTLEAEATLPLSERTIADALKVAGYKSYILGKWHLGGHAKQHPLQRGFDHFFGFLEGGHRYFASELCEGCSNYWSLLERDGDRVRTTNYLTDELTDAATGYIRDHLTPNDAAIASTAPPPPPPPFFLYLSYNAPHSPLQAPEKYLNQFLHIPEIRRRTYAAMVSCVDDGVGRVLTALRDTNAEESTIVVFLSDNGGEIRTNSADNSPLRGGKGEMFEGGIRVPFAMQWKGTLASGQKHGTPISSLDIAGTITALARVAAPPCRQLDGINLMPQLAMVPGSEYATVVAGAAGGDGGCNYDAAGTTCKRRALSWHALCCRGDVCRMCSAVLQEIDGIAFKYVSTYHGKETLYHLQINGTGEHTDIRQKDPEACNKPFITLAATMLGWRATLAPPALFSLTGNSRCQTDGCTVEANVSQYASAHATCLGDFSTVQPGTLSCNAACSIEKAQRMARRRGLRPVDPLSGMSGMSGMSANPAHCNNNEHVVNNKCTACPVGLTASHRYIQMATVEDTCSECSGLHDLTYAECADAVSTLFGDTINASPGRNFGMQYPKGCFNKKKPAKPNSNEYLYNTGGYTGPGDTDSNPDANPVRVCRGGVAHDPSGADTECS